MDTSIADYKRKYIKADSFVLAFFYALLSLENATKRIVIKFYSRTHFDNHIAIMYKFLAIVTLLIFGFPDADLCKIDYGQFFGTQYFYHIDEDKMTFIGAVLGFDTIVLENNLLFIEEGFSYGDTLWRSPAKGEYYLFDAIGHVTTPTGTYENCIRFQHELYSTGLNEYIWYQDNLMNEVAKVLPVTFDTLFGGDFGYVKYLASYEDNRVSATQELQGLGITATDMNRFYLCDIPLSVGF